MNDSRVWLVTGPQGAGKTTFCRVAAKLARKSNWDVAGLLSPAIIEKGHKVGIMAEDLRTGEMRPLATIAPKKDFDLSIGRWYFSRATLEWGAQRIGECLPCDLLIVDEFGPLELKHGRGWVAGLQVLRQPDFRQAVAVVRSALLDLALEQLPGSEVITLTDAQMPETAVQLWWNQIHHRAA